MQQIIPVSNDITLVKLKKHKKQAKMMLDLFQENKERLLPFFPGYYTQDLSLNNIQEFLHQKETKFNQNESYSFGICSKKERKMIGNISVDCFKDSGSISYWIDNKFKNKKIISQSFDKLREVLFQNNFIFLHAECDIRNKKSISFLKHKGFHCEDSFSLENKQKFVCMSQSKTKYQAWKTFFQQQREKE